MMRKRVWCALCALALMLAPISALGEEDAASAWIARYNDLASARGALVIVEDKVAYYNYAGSDKRAGFTYLGESASLNASFFPEGGMSELAFSTLSKDINIEATLRALILATDSAADADAAFKALELEKVLSGNSGNRALQVGNWYYSIECMSAGGNRYFSFAMIAPGQMPEGGIWDGLWGDGGAPESDGGIIAPTPSPEPKVYRI